MQNRDADVAVLIDYVCQAELLKRLLEIEDLLLGWKMGVSKRILGGSIGYSGGKFSRARKKPPKDFSNIRCLQLELKYLRRTLCRRQS